MTLICHGHGVVGAECLIDRIVGRHVLPPSSDVWVEEKLSRSREYCIECVCDRVAETMTRLADGHTKAWLHPYTLWSAMVIWRYADNTGQTRFVIVCPIQWSMVVHVVHVAAAVGVWHICVAIKWL
jgi:hypothetical protein